MSLGIHRPAARTVGRVDIDKLEPDEAAREYLVEHGLIK